MPQDMEAGRVIVGFLFEWQQGSDLSSIPSGYNVISVMFSAGNSGVPNLFPFYLSNDEVAAGVRELKREGRTVLVTLGGANTYIALNQSDQSVFINQLISSVDTFDFDGICIDLEGDAVTAADNQMVIPQALLTVKEYYRTRGKEFYITLAPEFPLLRSDTVTYFAYLDGLNGSYDLVFPQYYNQGNDGVWMGSVFLAQNDNNNKALFLYTLTNAIITGTQGYYRIPADKLAIGLPASPDAAFDGYVENPADVAWALDQLAIQGDQIRGLMTWSVNHDSFQNYDFIRSYKPIVFS